MISGALTRAPLSTLSVARGAFIALGASIPIATAVDTILIGAIGIAWLAAARFRETAEVVRANPVAAVGCLWLGVHVLAASYSIAAPAEAWRSVTKASLFLLIPVAALALKDARDIRLAHYAFMTAVAITVVLSYLRWAGVLLDLTPILKDPGYSASVVFKYHLTQNIMLAYGAFVFAAYARVAKTRKSRLFLGGCAVLAAVNVLAVGDGRTGQVVLFVLAIYYGGWAGGKRGAFAATLAAVVLGAAAYAMPGSSLQKRAALAIADMRAWQPGVEGKPSGVTERLEFYRRSLNIISEHPLLGVGSGGFAAADRDEAARNGMTPARHPHSEYLLKTVELGILGPLLMLAMFYVQWREAPRLAEPAYTAIARGLVLVFAVGSFGTSMLRDHAEALLFVWMTAVLFSTVKPAARRAR